MIDPTNTTGSGDGRQRVVERTLPNGLQVILREDHSAPLASFWVGYRVGSRNEVPGLTGLSHWVEHMQFKGTPSLAKGQIFRDVARHGGVLNAMTSNDWTAYFETLPVDQIDLSLAIESDRMTNSLFDPAETESERTVILSERQGAENRPTYLLNEEVIGAAFRAHPYRHMVIGHEADLRAISRDDLFDHYRRYYVPNNAFITAVGDFDAEELFTKIERAFGSVPSGPAPPAVHVEEPPRLAERRLILRRPAPTSYLRMAFPTPAARHRDTAALLVADAILSGAKGMGFGGGGAMGRSSRLYRALVAAGLARGAGSDFDLSIDPHLLVIGVTALPGVEPDRLEAVVDAELARLRDDEVSPQEMARVMKQVRAQYVYSADGVSNQAFWLGQMEIVDRYDRVDRFVDDMARVTAADVQRVTRTYLTPDLRTVGWLLPAGNEGGGNRARTGNPGKVLTAVDLSRPVSGGGEGSFGAPAQPGAFERHELANRVVILGQVRPGDRSAVVRIKIEAGARFEDDAHAGLAALTARSLPRGAGSRSFEEINEVTDDLGATFSVDIGRTAADLSIRCLIEDLPVLLDLAADILRRPIFPDNEIEKVRNELLTSIREGDNDTRAVADRAMRGLIFPEGHPFRRRVIGEIATMSVLTRDDLVAFHADHYGPAVITVAIVGGISSFPVAVELIDRRFGDWATAAEPAGSVAAPPLPQGSLRRSESIPGKSQADIAVGFPTIPRKHPDFYALDTANLILGRLGMMGRLGAEVRDAQGLAYYAFSQVEAGRDGSIWSGRAGVDPANIDRALDGIISEVRRLRAGHVSSEELADAKSYSTGILPLALETSSGVAGTLLTIEQYDLGLDFIERYPAIVDALTADELLTAMTTHIDPDRVVIGIAGPPISTSD